MTPCKHSWIAADNEAPYGRDVCRRCGETRPENCGEPEPDTDNGPTGHGDLCLSDADEGL